MAMNAGWNINMPTTIDDLTLSQLADGELPHDQTVAALLTALESDDARDRLRQHLQLRQMSAAWRSQTPSRDLLPSPPAPNCTPPGASSGQRPRRLAPGSNFLVASVVGGLLVLAGVWMGRTSWQTPQFVVSPAERQKIAQVFAFHESVAAPSL
jgi:hypothetical protein